MNQLLHFCFMRFFRGQSYLQKSFLIDEVGLTFFFKPEPWVAHQQIKPFVSDKSQKVIGQDKTLGQEHQHKHIFYDSLSEQMNQKWQKH